MAKAVSLYESCFVLCRNGISSQSLLPLPFVNFFHTHNQNCLSHSLAESDYYPKIVSAISGRVMDWTQQAVLITGGTGSFGKKFAEIMLREYYPKKLIIFSRDELPSSALMKLAHASTRCSQLSKMSRTVFFCR